MTEMPADPRLHATHDPELVAAYAAGDATGSDLAAAEGLVAGCAECATLHRDLRAIMAALPRVSAAVRPRDFRLTPGQAAAIRPPSRLHRLLAPLAGARFAFAGPAGAGLAALGLAGILLSGGLNVQPPSAAPAGNPSAAGPESGAVTSQAGAKDAGSAAPPMAFGPARPADRVAPSSAPSMAAAPASSAPSPAPPSGLMAIHPGPTGSDRMVDNGAGLAPPSPSGPIEGASTPSAAALPSTEAVAGGAYSAIAPPPPTTSPVAALGMGLLVAGLLLAGTRQVARRLA